MNLLPLEKIALHFVLSEALYSVSLPEHSGLCFHCIVSTLSSPSFSRQGYYPAHFVMVLGDLPKSPKKSVADSRLNIMSHLLVVLPLQSFLSERD